MRIPIMVMSKINSCVSSLCNGRKDVDHKIVIVSIISK